jgi:hypothetical protein
MARAPEKVTRQKLIMNLAPTALAAMPPNAPRNTGDLNDIHKEQNLTAIDIHLLCFFKQYR